MRRDLLFPPPGPASESLLQIWGPPGSGAEKDENPKIKKMAGQKHQNPENQKSTGRAAGGSRGLRRMDKQQQSLMKAFPELENLKFPLSDEKLAQILEEIKDREDLPRPPRVDPPAFG